MLSEKLKVLFLGLMAPVLLASCSAFNVKSGDGNENLDTSDEVLNLLDPDVKNEQDALAKAQAALQEGKADNALFYYVKVLQFNKNNVIALESIASIHEQGKHPELAIKVYQNILVLDKKHALANEKLGLYYLDKGQDGKAKQFLTQAVSTDKGRWRSFNGLGVIADLEGNTDEAIKQYQAALAESPSNPMLLNNLGFSYYSKGDAETARNLFSQALNVDTQFRRAIHNLALIEIKAGNFTSAVSLFNRIMKPQETYNNIGYIAMVNGQYDVAEEYFKRAIDENPVYFPKAQENLKNLLDLKSARGGYPTDGDQVQQIKAPPEIQKPLIEAPPPSKKPETTHEKFVKPSMPTPPQKSAASKKSINKTLQMTAKPVKKKTQLNYHRLSDSNNAKSGRAGESASMRTDSESKKIKPAPTARHEDKHSEHQASRPATPAQSVPIKSAKPAETATVLPPIAKESAQQTTTQPQPKSVPEPQFQPFVKKNRPIPAMPLTATPSLPLEPAKKNVFVTDITAVDK